jgi:hypothetical protein
MATARRLHKLVVELPEADGEVLGRLDIQASAQSKGKVGFRSASE